MSADIISRILPLTRQEQQHNDSNTNNTSTMLLTTTTIIISNLEINKILVHTDCDQVNQSIIG